MSTTDATNAAASDSALPDVPFASNEIRLSPRECLISLAIVSALLYLIPVAWERIEPLESGPDYRIPYRLGYDYWTANRYFRQESRQRKTLVVGDSVVWGHYVGKHETLSHYLNELAGEHRFANLGVDGIHPAALCGLIEHYGGDISGQDVILNCNLLWMSSKRHDLRIEKEFAFNHPDLVPQFSAGIPCYREPISGRIGIVIGREMPFFGWAKHLGIAYFDDTDVPTWTIEHPHDNPVAAVTLKLPSPDEPPSPEPIAKPWTEQGIGKFNPPWVELETSFQWSRLNRCIELLRRRDNRVFVIVGPFNEHMLTEDSLAVYNQRKREAENLLREAQVPCFVPEALPSEHYADASHPLAEGYRLLAERLYNNPSFVSFREGKD